MMKTARLGPAMWLGIIEIADNPILTDCALQIEKVSAIFPSVKLDRNTFRSR